jgi:hypothetical protein
LETGVEQIATIRTCVLVLVAALTLGELGCDDGGGHTVSPRSRTEVKLPPAPDLDVQLPPMRHPGGVWTIEGVLRSTRELNGSTVEVRGVVVAAHHCPKHKPGEPAVDCHPPAHFYLADRAGEERYQLLVTGLESRIVEMAREGLELTLRGRMDVMSDGGAFIRQAGVLVLPPTPSQPETPAATVAPTTP